MATRDAVIPQAERMFEGNMHKSDVWSIFTPVNVPADCINLGQGFMNWSPPSWITEELNKVMQTDVMVNHYSHPRGRPRLLNALKNHFSPRFENLVKEGRELKTEEVMAAAGANCGTYAALVAHVNPGEEVILFEPFFDQYFASIRFQGATPVYVPLHPPADSEGVKSGADWSIDFKELRAAFSDKTKAIIINTPHNPVGKVFTRQELEQIAELCKEFNVLCLADEVYDCMLYDGVEHVRMASLPGMWERTITIGSGGKSFACTGWRIGWLIGEQKLISATLAAHSRLVFCTNSPLQEAVAIGLEQSDSRNFFGAQLEAYRERRDVLCSYFDQLGLSYTKPEGAYFLLVDMSDVQVPESFEIPDFLTQGGRGKDFIKCWWLTQEIGVVAIPPSEFYSKEHEKIGERFARFSFCKDPKLLHAAGKRLLRLKEFIKTPQANGK